MVQRQERQLLKAIRAGSHEGYAEVVRRHYAAIYRFLLHLGGESHEAEDLTQETFAAAWANISRFRGKVSLKSWLHRIAYNKFVDAKRQLKRQRAVKEQLENRTDGQASFPGPMVEAMTKERTRQVYSAVQGLDEDQREIIVLHYFQGLSFKEMAQVLDEPTGTVKWRTSRALGQLKSAFDGRV